MPRVPVVIETLCTGCDICVQLCPEVFELNEDLVAVVRHARGDSEEAIQEAIDLCPESCIRWHEISE